MNLRNILRNFRFLTLTLVLLLCDCIEPQDMSDDSTTSVEDENDINNDQRFKVEVVSDVSVDLVTNPKKIGEIEFDVEVHEVLPQKEYTSPPEIVFMSESGSDTSDDKPKAKVEVFTDVAVELVASPKKIGDIQLDIEVEDVVPKKKESRAPEIVVIPQKGDTVLPYFGHKANDIDFSQTIHNFEFKDLKVTNSAAHDLSHKSTLKEVPEMKIRNFAADQDLSDNSSTDSQSTTLLSVTGDVNITGLPEGEDNSSEPGDGDYSAQSDNSDSSDSITDGSPGGESPTDQPIPNSTDPNIPPAITAKPEKAFFIWPIIFVALIFIAFILIGLCWGLSSFFKNKAEEVEEEKQVTAKTGTSAPIQDSSGQSSTPTIVQTSSQTSETPVVTAQTSSQTSGTPVVTQDSEAEPPKDVESMTSLSYRSSDSVSSLEMRSSQLEN